MRYAMLVIGIAALGAGCGRGPTAPTGPVSGPQLFGLAGSVVDSAGRPIEQAHVEVLNGTQKGVVAVTDAEGAFSFGSIFDSAFTLRASKEARLEQTKQILNAQSDTAFKLSPDIRGNYEITFTADTACAGLPMAARSRTYSASFGLATDSLYLATLGGADFARSSSPAYPNWNVMYVTVSEDAVRMSFNDPEIWEHLTRTLDMAPEAGLTILGDATSPVPSRLDTSQGAFTGRFLYCAAEATDAYPECQIPEITCVSQHHRFSLTRK